MKRKQNEAKVRGRNVIASANPQSPISEQYRVLRTNIQFSMIDKTLRTLACTSATPGEGKSTTIVNLAVTFAQQGQRVLLVDGDLRRPVVHDMLGVSNRFGLTSLITKRATMETAIVSVPRIENLYVLPAGAIPPNPAELLGSKSMADLIQELALNFDLVLFDTPPVLAVADAQIIGNRCDGALLVVKSHKVEKKELVRTKELLEQANVSLIGTVLNEVNPKEMNHGAYYGYGYGQD